MTTRAAADTESHEMEEDDGEPPRPFQLESYADLLRFPAIPGGPPNTAAGSAPFIDAIIVPTIRSPEHLTSAAELARRIRCQLIPLYTHAFPSGLSPVLAKLGQGMVTPLALRSGAAHHLLDLAARLSQDLTSGSALDISKKRNLGLLIGRACGWTRMLLLDDDIRELSTRKLGSAASLLDQYPVVGLQVSSYPDASVVGHARRLSRQTGRRQMLFISGGSLLVNPQRLQGFFPPVYHEDWLCIINHLRHGEVAIGGKVGQLKYQPFTTPHRARLEEFGEILAAGLLWLVHASKKANIARSKAPANDSSMDQRGYWHKAKDTSFWAAVLQQRAELLDDIIERLELTCQRDSPMSPLTSLEAARLRRDELNPEEFVSFVERWLVNLAAWQARLSKVSRSDSVAKAVTDLGLSHVVRMYEPDRRPVRGTVVRWLAGVGRASSVIAGTARNVRDAAVPGVRVGQAGKAGDRTSPPR